MVTYPPGFHLDILRRNCDLTDEWQRAFPNVRVSRDSFTLPPPVPQDRIEKLCAVRNTMLDRHLDPTAGIVVWLDSDIVEFPVDFFAQLVETANTFNAVVAPSIFVERKPGMFYDIWGFVKDEKFFTHEPPYAQTKDKPDGPLMTVESVGCLYALPASLFHRGFRYHAIPKQTDHYSLCQRAKEQEMPVYWDCSIWATHVNLREYGLPWN